MHEAWGPYPDTLLHFPEAGLTVDLRLPVTAKDCMALAGLGLPEAFAVVTACNPLGHLLEPPANARLGAILAAVVSMQHPRAIRADGGAPGAGHLEVGWALPTPIGTARQLAARFFQNAMFWFEDGRFSVIPVLAPGPVLVLPHVAAAR